VKTGEESCVRRLRERVVLAVGRMPADGKVAAKALGSTLGWWAAVVRGGDGG
jgi:hypothetical protein